MIAIDIDSHFPLGTVTGQFRNAGRNLCLTAPFRWVDGDLTIDVAIGFETDFNSVPRGLWNFFPPWEYPEAAVVHDYLYRNPHGFSRNTVDAIHNKIMKVEGASWRLRKIARLGLLLGGWVPWNKYREAEYRKGHAGPKDAA